MVTLSLDSADCGTKMTSEKGFAYSSTFLDLWCLVNIQESSNCQLSGKLKEYRFRELMWCKRRRLTLTTRELNMMHTV